MSPTTNRIRSACNRPYGTWIAHRSKAVYIGDHTVDAEAAGRAGVPFVAVLTGTAGRHHFDTAQCLGILDDLSALPSLLGH